MKKVYIKFRLEELEGNYLLFQILEQDKRFNGNTFGQIVSSACVEIVENGIYLRGSEKERYLEPSINHFESAKTRKEYALHQLSEFWKWEGFAEDFNQSEIVQRWEDLLTRNGKRYIIKGKKVYLDYDIWQKDNYTYLKVNFADDCLKNIRFYGNYFESLERSQPILNCDCINFKGELTELDNNVDFIVGGIVPNCGEINNQLIKFLTEKYTTKQPELVEVQPNIYELSVEV